MTKQQSELLSVMFVDIVGYTTTTTKLSRSTFIQLHDVFDTLVGRASAEFHGHIIKKIGDAFLLTFKSSTDAIHCGMELQNAFKQYNERHNPPIPLYIRVAIHTGEVLLRNGDVFGDTVNTAARLESFAKAGQVIFSESSFLAMNKNELPYTYLGAKKLKGLAAPIKIFKVETRLGMWMKHKRIAKKRRKNALRRQLIALGAFAWSVFGSLLVLWMILG